MRLQLAFLVLAALVLQACALYLDVAAGNAHYLFLKDNRTIMAWGMGEKGQLGNGVASYTPTMYPEPMYIRSEFADKHFAQVHGGNLDSYVLTTDGAILACGMQGPNGLLGRTESFDYSPYLLAVNMTYLEGRSVTQMSVGKGHLPGKNHILLLTSDKVYAWGAAGPLGNAAGVKAVQPMPIEGTAMDGKVIKSVSAGGAHSIVLCTDGTVFGFGSNQYGQLGTGEFNATNVNLPVAMNLTALNGDKVVQAVAGTSFTALLTASGAVYSVGNNDYGQLGDGSNKHRNLPTPPAWTQSLQGTKLVSIAAGFDVVAGLTDTGALLQWGGYTYYPTLLPSHPGGSKIVKVAVGDRTVIHTDDNSLYYYSNLVTAAPTKVELAPPPPPPEPTPEPTPIPTPIVTPKTTPTTSTTPTPLVSEVSSASTLVATWTSALIAAAIVCFL